MRFQRRVISLVLGGISFLVAGLTPSAAEGENLRKLRGHRGESEEEGR